MVELVRIHSQKVGHRIWGGGGGVGEEVSWTPENIIIIANLARYQNAYIGMSSTPSENPCENLAM